MSKAKRTEPDAGGSDRLMVCTLPEGGSIAVQLAEQGRRFTAGDVLDLDAEAAPGLTWRAALGAHADAFAPVPEDTFVE